MISNEDIKNLASLARIELTKKVQEDLKTDIEAILLYIGQIQEVEIENELTENQVIKNVMREDVEAHQTGLYTESLMKEVPSEEKNYVKVKKIL